MSRHLIFSVGLIGFLVIGSISPIWGAQLDARLSTHLTEAQPTFKFLKTVFIEYSEGGEISELLNGQDILVSIEANKDTPGVAEIIQSINNNLRDSGSTTFVTDLELTYRAHLVGHEGQAAIDYKVTMVPTITGYLLREADGKSPALLDAHWRGITIEGPAIISDEEHGDVDVNMLIGFLKSEAPDVYEKIAGTEGETLLYDNLIDASVILAQPLSNWHHLFDPTATISETAKWGYSEKLVVTSFTMGESNLREGIQREIEKSAEFTTDKTYAIRTVESANSATIQIDGFVTETILEGSEVFGSSPKVPEGYATTSTGGFPVGVMYGFAAAGVAGAVVVFIWSDKKIKKQRGQ